MAQRAGKILLDALVGKSTIIYQHGNNKFEVKETGEIISWQDMKDNFEKLYKSIIDDIDSLNIIIDSREKIV